MDIVTAYRAITWRIIMSNLVKDFFDNIESYFYGIRYNNLMTKLNEVPTEVKEEIDKLELDDTVLYRGLYFNSKEELKEFLSKLNREGLVENKITSWTSDTGISMDFMYGAGYYFYNKLNSRDHLGYGVVLSHQPENKDISCSFDIIKTFVNEIKEIESLSILTNNEEEYILKPGTYNVELTYATENCKSTIEGIQILHPDAFPFVNYVDEEHDII